MLFGALFLIIAFWPLWPIPSPHSVWLSAAAVTLVAGLVLPRLLTPFYRAWMRFSHVLGWVNVRIILGFVFFVLVTPIGLFMRLFGKDMLQIRCRPSGSSTWVRRDGPVDPQSLRNQF